MRMSNDAPRAQSSSVQEVGERFTRQLESLFECELPHEMPNQPAFESEFVLTQSEHSRLMQKQFHMEEGDHVPGHENG